MKWIDNNILIDIIGTMAYFFVLFFIIYIFWLKLNATFSELVFVLSLFVLLGWLQAEDIAFFIAIIVSLSFSSKVFENVHNFLKLKEKDLWIERINKKLIKPFYLTYSEWDGKVQLLKIALSITLCVIYLIFKYTEKTPLIFEFSYSFNKSNLNIENLSIIENLFLYIPKSLDRIFGVEICCFCLLTINSVRNFLSNLYQFPQLKKLDKWMIWLLFFIAFILPIGLNIYINSQFESKVETRLEDKEGIKKAEYELEFINRHNYQIKEKRIEVKIKGRTYSYPYSYYYIPKNGAYLKLWDYTIIKELTTKEVSRDD